MKKLSSLVVASALSITSLFGADMVGSGASFPYSVYQQWLKDYHKKTGVQVDYIKKGSSKGIKDSKARLNDFGGTDKPLSPAILKRHNLYQFPTVVGAISMAYNIPGVKDGELFLSEKAIVGIADGTVKHWDNPVIMQTNEHLNLPHKEIAFVHRADGSGTTYNFTYYLSKIDNDWKKNFGAKKRLNWKAAQPLGGKHNSGMAAIIKQTPYSIGYMDVAVADQNGFGKARVENREGLFVYPTRKAIQAGAGNAVLDPKKDFYGFVAYPKGVKSYPILATTFILLPAEKTEMNKKVTKFFDYAYTEGDKAAEDLGFIAFPQTTKDKIKAYWKEKGVY